MTWEFFEKISPPKGVDGFNDLRAPDFTGEAFSKTPAAR
jgi:hypothetical protein